MGIHLLSGLEMPKRDNPGFCASTEKPHAGQAPPILPTKDAPIPKNQGDPDPDIGD